MSFVEELIQNLENESDRIRHELNKDYFFTSFLEEPFLYHTTTWERLKSILKEGFLTGNSAYLENKKIHQMHPNMICFTTSKWRHLSNLPDGIWITITGITHNCYLKIPFDSLKDKVKPVIYKIDESEIKDLLDSGQAYYLATLTQKVDELKRQYGEDFGDYLYHTWYVENEWRMKADKFPLPPETEVYVSTYHQLKVARTLTHLPVKLDREIMRLDNKLKEPKRIKRHIKRIIGEEFYKKIKAIEVYKNDVKRPCGKTSKLSVILYDVRFLDAQIIVKRLLSEGYTVWTYGRPYKYRAYADLYVDLTLKPERNPSSL